MRTVRLYVLQDSTRCHEDIPFGYHLERIAEIEMSGGTVYHASVLAQPKKARNFSATARLRQRLY